MFKKYSQFYKSKETEQKPNAVVDITGWSIGELSPYQEGARDKGIVESPDKLSYKFLVPKHKYLLKKAYAEESGAVLHWQFWNEIIAYKVGRILGIPVPPAFVGYYGRDDGSEPYYGALIEWFYDYGDSKDTSYRGGDLIGKYILGYERCKGAQHNFKTIIKICTDYNVEDCLKTWTEILLFDAIIANTDRHHDNWQIIKYSDDTRYYLSPAFDNGTSMGYNFRPQHLKSKSHELEQYLKRGYHHMKWALSDNKSAGHLELLQKLRYHFPETLGYMKNIFDIDILTVTEDIENLTKFTINDERYKLSKERAGYIIELIVYRFNSIKRELIS